MQKKVILNFKVIFKVEFYKVQSTDFKRNLPFFEHIFEHINCPLFDLYYNTDKCRSEE